MHSLAIVIPVLGRDHAFLPALLDSIAVQDCQPAEVIIATDDPNGVIIAKDIHLPIRVLHNSIGATACALNLAIQSTACEFIIRFDVRAHPQSNYVSRCLAALDGKADIIGGQLLIVPGGSNDVASAIALAVSHPLGAGDARYRIGGQMGDVDTVPYPCFRRDLWERIGGYNESLGANEDYEFNWRVRQAGGRILFDPSIKCGYIARDSFRALAEQYFRYGWWKVQMLRQHPRSARWRQLLPLVAPALFAVLLLASMLWPALMWLPMGLAFIYLVALLAVALRFAITKHSVSLVWALPIAFITIATAWSSGAWVNLLTGGRWPFR